jgi:hypothetical protein
MCYGPTNWILYWLPLVHHSRVPFSIICLWSTFFYVNFRIAIFFMFWMRGKTAWSWSLCAHVNLLGSLLLCWGILVWKLCLSVARWVRFTFFGLNVRHIDNYMTIPFSRLILLFCEVDLSCLCLPFNNTFRLFFFITRTRD